MRWKQHRMAPGRIGADQHQQIGFVEILIAAGHGVGAEGAALVAGDRGGHAEPRVAVQVVGPQQPLRELVGDVVVLGQQLAGEVEGDRSGPCCGR